MNYHPAFPIEVLPPRLRHFIQETAQALPCAVDMVAVAALAAVSAAIGASRQIRIKNSWDEPAALFVAIVAPTGSLKTPALKHAIFPVFEQQKRFEEAVKNIPAEEKADEKPTPPPRAYTADVTVEGLGQLLKDSPYGLLLYRDELSAWVKSMDQYRGGKGADRQFYLSAWSGVPISSDRVGRPSICVEHPFLSVVGGIPPDILQDLADDKGREDGFLPRMLFAFPEQVPVRWSNADIAAQTRENYASLFQELYELEFEKDSLTENKRPVLLPLTPQALERFIRWHDSHCDAMEQASLSATLKGFYSKLKGYCPRLALIHALCVDPTTSTVGVGSIEAAITMAEYFKQQAAKVCALLTRPKTTPMERCEREILRNLSHGRILTKRELQQGGNAEAKVFNPVFNQLLASGHMSETERTGKRGMVKAYQLTGNLKTQ